MGSAAPPKHNFWRGPMAKPSLVHRFAQVLLSPKKEVSKREDEEARTDVGAATPAASTSDQQRVRLEMDVKSLSERLQRETELRSTLENGMKRVAGAFSTFPRNLPAHAQELLTDIAMLEVAVSNLEDQMIGLEMQIRHERRERLKRVTQQPLTTPSINKSDHERQQKTISVPAPKYTRERLSFHEIIAQGSSAALVESTEYTRSNQEEVLDYIPERIEYQSEEEVQSQSSSSGKRGNEMIGRQEATKLYRCKEADAEVEHEGITSGEGKLWKHPNQLSQEMLSCMISIYCHLAEPSDAVKQMTADNVLSPSSPFCHATCSSLSSVSDLSNVSFAKSPPQEPKVKEDESSQSILDPYRTYDKLEWGDIGTYSKSMEVAWMSVGKEQLQYVADALRFFRSLVEQLSKVDATSLSHDEKLAFWINIYNALMMHAYLAYGFPKNDVKHFALMQKAAYTVGGHFFNAMAIEHVLLRCKAPSYRPQIALLLALHKIKIPEGASTFAISRPEPLVVFALSCGAWSSPAVRIYTADNIQTQLQTALHDYVRASLGIGRRGKVLVPKLLHCYARELNIHKASGDTDDGHALISWLSSFLPERQTASLQNMAQRCMSRTSTANSPLFSFQPFNLQLRYLFLHQLGTN